MATRGESSASSASEEEGDWHTLSNRRPSQFLSADQLELWRQVLRDEIEEDLERQVRDRLGWYSRPSVSPPVPVEGRQVHYQPPHKKPEMHRPARRLTKEPVEVPVEAPVEVPVEVVPVEAPVMEPGRTRDIARTRMVKEVRVKAGHHTTTSLEDYVHSKYGVPTEQLSHVLTQQGLNSRTVDTSGCGRGPLIRVPIEASVLLPTPTHGTPTHNTPTHGRAYHTTNSRTVLTTQAAQTPPPDRATLANADSTLSPHPPPQHSHHLPPQHSHHPSPPHSHHLPPQRSHHPSPPHSHNPPPPQHPPAHTTPGSEEGLQFEARFECGNLHKTQQIGPCEYNLWLNFDLYSTKHTQWFYFRVEGMVAMTTYTFHIVNLYKPDSLYNYGMQPLLFSRCEESLGRGEGGWSRAGRGVSYTHSTHSTHLYTLSWSMEFPHTCDECYLAQCYPYTYSHLLTLVSSLETCPHVRQEELCTTLAGNVCPLITITDTQGSAEDRQVVVVSGRVHPGETNSSWIMEGLLHMLTGDTPHAKALRSAYVFKCVPMLNPDGVVVGNYRTSLAGVDLNRVYKTTALPLFPTVASIKALVDQLLNQGKEVALYVDLHGHSRKHNVFMYGCHAHHTDHTHFLRERLFPFLLSQQAPQMFSLSSCKYSVERCKEATGRVVMWRRGVTHSLTLEASFCGSTLQGGSPQFTSQDLLDMGQCLGEAVYRLYKCSASKSVEQRVLGQLAEEIMRGAQPNLPDLVTAHDSSPRKAAKRAFRRFLKFDLSQIMESSTSGSDSENDEFEFRRKKASCRVKRVRGRSVPHTRTQPLLPSLTTHPSHPTHPSHHSHHSQRRRSIPAVRSCVPLPQLVRFSAPPRLTSEGKGWKFVNKYKGRSNGGIPMFSEERLKERAEKRLNSVSMLQPSTTHTTAPSTHTTAHTTSTSSTKQHSKEDKKKQRHFPVLWERSLGVEVARVTGSSVSQSDTRYSSLRHQLLRQRGKSKGQLSPALAQFIRELWTNQ